MRDYAQRGLHVIRPVREVHDKWLRAPLLPLTPQERQALHRDLGRVGLKEQKSRQTLAA
jgi:hypothetical protein